VAARLRRFRLRTKVDVAQADWPCVALRGAGVPAAQDMAGAAGGPPGSGTPEHGGPWVVPVEWNGTVGVDLLGPGAENAVPGDARWCGPEAWEAVRIEAGIPAMGAELDAKTIAAEAGLVERTVSFTKGCYTGQELVARLDARGNRVARRLCGVVLDGGVVPGERVEAATVTGAVLWAPGGVKPVGRCTSAAWCPGVGGLAALAYLHRSIELPGDVEWSFPGPAPSQPDAQSSVADPAEPDARATRRAARVVALPLVAG
jgi:tRNA-modifying protein YgfZ